MWIFYKWPTFACVAFIIPQTLILTEKLWNSTTVSSLRGYYLINTCVISFDTIRQHLSMIKQFTLSKMHWEYLLKIMKTFLNSFNGHILVKLVFPQQFNVKIHCPFMSRHFCVKSGMFRYFSFLKIVHFSQRIC